MTYRFKEEVRIYWQYKNNTPITFYVHSFRSYGQPKLSKPKDLRGIKQSLSVDYIPGKCRCPVFIKADDVWIRHNDYFSETMRLPLVDMGMPLEYLAKKYEKRDKRKKFVYPDTWGSIVLRSQAWLRIKNLYKQIKEGAFPLDIVLDIREQQEETHKLDKYSLCCSDMERFWERVISQVKDI